MSILRNLIPLLPTLALALTPIAVSAESTFRLAYPDTFGRLPAAYPPWYLYNRRTPDTS